MPDWISGEGKSELPKNAEVLGEELTSQEKA